MSALEKILAAIKPSVKIVQAFAPLSPGPNKMNTALAIIAALAGVGTTIPNKYVAITSALVSLTVSELQESGEIVKDQSPAK